MQLTQRQELYINRYIRAFADELGDVSSVTHDQAVAQLRNRLWAEIRRLGHGPYQDADIAAIFRAIGSPKHQAETYVQKYGTGRGLTLALDDRIWLGVWGGLAEWSGIPSSWLRTTAMVLGLITGPLALMIYLGIYFEMYVNTQGIDEDRFSVINKGKVVRMASGVLGSLLAIDIGTRILLYAINKGYEIMVPARILRLGTWGWLQPNLGFYLFCALAICTPMGILSALPLARRWDETLRRITQVSIMVYALVICFGLACALVGIILTTAQHVAATTAS